MVVACLQAVGVSRLRFGQCIDERSGFEQFVELVACTLINQNITGPALFLDQNRRVMCCPECLISSEIGPKLFAALVGSRGVCDRRKG